MDKVEIVIDTEVVSRLKKFNNPLLTEAALNLVASKIVESGTIKNLGKALGGNDYGAELLSYGIFNFICFEEIIDRFTTKIIISNVYID